MSNQNPTTQKTRGLEVTEHIEFQSTIETNLTTTQELGTLINGFFRPILADYEGCFISINQQTGALGVSLYFKDKGEPSENQIKCIAKRGTAGDKASVTEKLSVINNTLSKKRVYDLTTEVKEVLSEFFDVSNINWGQAVFENTANMNNYSPAYTVITGVAGLSVNRILRKIYGKKDENGKEIQYDTKIMRPISNDPYNFIISVMRLNNDTLQQFATKIGMINNPIYSFPIIPAV